MENITIAFSNYHKFLQNYSTSTYQLIYSQTLINKSGQNESMWGHSHLHALPLYTFTVLNSVTWNHFKIVF